LNALSSKRSDYVSAVPNLFKQSNSTGRA